MTHSDLLQKVICIFQTHLFVFGKNGFEITDLLFMGVC